MADLKNIDKILRSDGSNFFDPIGSFGNPFSGALVTLASDELTANYTSATAVPLDAEIYDIGEWHDNSTNNTRLTVPAGITKVRLVANVSLLLTTGLQWVQFDIRKNGSGEYSGSANVYTEIDRGADALAVSSPVLDVVAGDYFEMFLRTEADASITVESDLSWFSIEAVESVAPASKVIGPWLELDRQVAAASASIDFFFNPSLYDEVEIAIIDVVPSTNLQRLELLVSTDGATFKSGTSDYEYANHGSTAASASVLAVNEINADHIRLVDGLGDQTGEVGTGHIKLLDPSNTTKRKPIQYFMSVADHTAAEARIELGAGYYHIDTAAISGLRLIMGAGNITTGTFILRARPKAGVDFYSSNRSLTGMPFLGAFVRRATDKAIGGGADVTIDWESVEYDVGGWFNLSGAPTVFTVPAGVTKVKLIAQMRTVGITATSFRIRKVGSSKEWAQINSGSVQMQIVTPVIDVFPGDQFHLIAFDASSTTLDADADTDLVWFSIEAVEAIAPSTNPRGALVTLATDELTADYSMAIAIPFDEEVYDTDDIHDNSTNNSRLTVPSGVTHVRLTAAVVVDLTTTNEYAIFNLRKNDSADFAGAVQQYTQTSRVDVSLGFSSGILEVVAGDYFEAFLRIQTDASVTILDDRSWFHMEIVNETVVAGAHEFLTLRDTPASYSGKALNVARVNLSEDAIELVDPSLGSFGNPFSGAQVTLAADEIDADYVGANKTVPFDAETYDIGGWHSNTINNTRLTVPSGVTKVRVTVNIRAVNATNDEWMFVTITKNGSHDWPGEAGTLHDATIGSRYGQATTGVVNVVPGDYFEVEIQNQADAMIDIIASRTSFWIEAVESVAPASKVIGPWLELDRQVVSAVTEIDFTFNPDLYDELEIVGTDITSSADSFTLGVRVSGDGGATFESGGSDYEYATHVSGSNASHAVSDSALNDSAIKTWDTWGNAGDEKGAIRIAARGLSSITQEKFIDLNFSFTNADNIFLGGHTFGKYKADNTLKINGLRILETTSGDSITGEFILRGRPKAGVDFYSSSRSLTGMPFSGALVNLLSDESLTTTAGVPWDESQYDIGGWFDLSGNPTRLTVPTGITKVRVQSLTPILNGIADFQIHLQKNGASVKGNAYTRSAANAPAGHTVGQVSAVLEVVAGDYFELIPFFSSGTPDLRADAAMEGAWFSIEAVEAIAPSVTPRGALGSLAVELTGVNYTTATTVPFDQTNYDTENMFDIVSNKGRITVPSGVTHVKLSGQITWGNLTGGWTGLDIYKNDVSASQTDGGAFIRTEISASTTHAISASSAILEVIAGDFFEMKGQVEADTSQDVQVLGTWFSMEIVEPAIIAGLSPDTLSAKASVVAATDAAGTLATSFEAGDTVDGITLAVGDRILIKDQSAGAENGIYVVRPTGAPSRAADANSILNTEQGNYVFVAEGTENGATSWLITTDNPIIPDTDAQVWTSAGGGGGASSFTALTDTPSSYSGEQGKIAVVNEAEDGLEFLTGLDASVIAGETSQLFHVREEKSSGTTGGTAEVGFQTRILNTVVTNEITGASLSTNQITLPAGTYDVEATFPSYDSNRSVGRLRNITDTTTLLLGNGNYMGSGDVTQAQNHVRGRITLTGTKVLELQDYRQTQKTTDGLGIASESGQVEVYADIQIRRVGTSVPFTKVVGPWVEIDRQTVSAVTEIDFTFDPDLYDEIEIVGQNVTSSGDAWVPALRISTDGGATFEAGTGYDFAAHVVTAIDGHGVAESTANASYMGWWIGFGNVGDEKADFTITSYDLGNTTHEKTFKLESIYADASANSHVHAIGSGRYKAATSTKINGIRFFELDGDSLTGTFILRGRPKAGIDFFHGEVVGGNVGAPFAGATVKLDADLTADFDPAIAVAWESREYSVGGSWWNSTLPTRLTVPSGVSKIRIGAHLWTSGEDATTTTLAIYKNGSANWIGFASTLQTQPGGAAFMSATTGVVEVVEGDYFEAFYGGSDTSTTVESERSTFTIEAVEAIAPSSKVIGPWLEIDRQVASASSEIDFTFNPLLYDELEIEIVNLAPTADNDSLWARVSLDGGATFEAAGTDYDSVKVTGLADTDLISVNGTEGLAQMNLMGGMDNAADRKGIAKILLQGMDVDGDKTLLVVGAGNTVGAGNWRSVTGAHKYKQNPTSNVDAIRFLMSTSTIATGTFILRGRPKDGVDFFHTKDSIEKVGIPFSGALVKLDAVESIDNDTNTPVPWDSETYDIGDWWSSGDPTRFTVPAGVSKVRLAGNIEFDNVFSATTTLRTLYFFQKNGSAVLGTANNRRMQFETAGGGVNSAVLEVIEGDYFELLVNHNEGAPQDLGAGNNTWFSIEAVEGVAPKLTPRGALVSSSALQEITQNTFTAIDWNQEEYDTDNIHDNVTNNSRLTVPSGVTHVRLSGNVVWEGNSTSWRDIHFMKNDARFPGSGSSQIDLDLGINHQQNINSAIIEVVAGDYFELVVIHDVTTSLDILSNDHTWFSMEIVEPVLLGDGGPMDIALFLGDIPTVSSQLFLTYTFVRNAFFSKNLVGSQGNASTAATAETDVDIQKNGSSIGTVRWAAAGTIPTFIFSTSQQFVPGDTLSLVGPGSIDLTLADISITLKGERR